MQSISVYLLAALASLCLFGCGGRLAASEDIPPPPAMSETKEEAADPAKADTGLFFFKGEEGTPFAICNAGGAFALIYHQGVLLMEKLFLNIPTLWCDRVTPFCPSIPGGSSVK